jgi:hypothetical protein
VGLGELLRRLFAAGIAADSLPVPCVFVGNEGLGTNAAWPLEHGHPAHLRLSLDQQKPASAPATLEQENKKIIS